MRELLKALGSGRAVVLFGAGLSQDVGLPGWGDLTVTIIAGAEAEFERDFGAAREHLSRDDLSAALGSLERDLAKALGKDAARAYLMRKLSEALGEGGGKGTANSILAKLPVKMYFTTNYDDVFERHLREADYIPNVHTNLLESLEELDPGNYDKTLVYLHGSLVHGGRFVITDSDYQRVIQAKDFAALRQTLSAYLTNSPVVLVGYSLNDPDLREVAHEVAGVIRRRHPVVMLLAGADSATVEEYSLRYNVKVIPYSAADGHSELRRILGTITKWLQAPQVGEVADEQGLALAQALYIREAALSSGEVGIHAALESLILWKLSGIKEPMGLQDLHSSLVRDVGLSADSLPADLLPALGVSADEDLLSGPPYRLTETGARWVSAASRKYRRLWENLYDDVQAHVADGLGPMLERILVDLFAERSAEAVNLAFREDPIETSSLALFDLIAKRTGEIDPDVRYAFVDYVVDMFRFPNETQRAIIRHLGRSLFSANVLKLDAGSNESIRTMVSSRSLVLDSNLLISLLAVGNPSHLSMASLIRAAKDNGVLLFTTPGFLGEALAHAEWAERFYRANQNDDGLLLSAAQGQGIYDGNDFLNGLMATSNDLGTRRDIADYFRDCFDSGTPRPEVLVASLLQRYGIQMIARDQLGSEGFTAVKKTTQEYIQSDAGAKKNTSRVAAEAEAYAVMHEWDDIRVQLALPIETRLYLLSAAGYLNCVASKSPHPLNRNVIITPYSLGGVISSYLNSKALHDFGTLVRAEFFNCASDMLERAQLERYFAVAIRSAERAYSDVLQPKLRQFDAELIPFEVPDDLSGVPSIERPEVVRSLTAYVADVEASSLLRETQEKLAAAEADVAELRAVADKAAELKAEKQKRKERYLRGPGRQRR